VLFIGQHEHTIDAKGRLAIPAEIRAQWRAEDDGGAWYALPWIGGVIRLFTETEFKTLADPVMPRTLALGEDEAALKRLLFGRSARLEMDAAGRIRLPESMLKAVGLGKEVVLIGCGDCLEVANRSDWQASEQDDLEQLASLLQRMQSSRDNGGT
jgi:MraZ protein